MQVHTCHQSRQYMYGVECQADGVLVPTKIGGGDWGGGGGCRAVRKLKTITDEEATNLDCLRTAHETASNPHQGRGEITLGYFYSSCRDSQLVSHLLTANVNFRAHLVTTLAVTGPQPIHNPKSNGATLQRPAGSDVAYFQHNHAEDELSAAVSQTSQTVDANTIHATSVVANHTSTSTESSSTDR